MANVSLKTDFKDGEKLFGQQLNNNFAVIKAALEAMNKIVWQDDPDDSISAFRGTTEEINQRDIIDGQLLYDTSTGETYIDVGSQRISTGSGNAIFIGDTVPTNPSTQLWINPEESILPINTEVVNSMEGSETNKAPSVASAKSYIDTATDFKGNLLWTNYDPTEAISQVTNISLSSNDYDILEVIYIQSTSNTDLMYSTKFLKGGSTRMRISSTDGANIYRGITYLTDTSYRIELPYSDNTKIAISTISIPLYIIGYKTGIFDGGGN